MSDLMTPQHDGYEIEISGESHRIRLSYAAFRFAQTEHNSDLDLTEFGDGFDPAKIASLCWVGLLHENPEMTERDMVIKLMSATPDEHDKIHFVLGKAMAKLGASVENFQNGAASIQIAQNVKPKAKATRKR